MPQRIHESHGLLYSGTMTGGILQLKAQFRITRRENQLKQITRRTEREHCLGIFLTEPCLHFFLDFPIITDAMPFDIDKGFGRRYLTSMEKHKILFSHHGGIGFQLLPGWFQQPGYAPVILFYRYIRIPIHIHDSIRITYFWHLSTVRNHKHQRQSRNGHQEQEQAKTQMGKHPVLYFFMMTIYP